MRKTISFFVFILISSLCKSQIIIPIIFGSQIMPEYGFLPGRKFPVYKTINSFDFQKRAFRVELSDEREHLKLSRIECSDIDINNASEFSSPQTIFKIAQYVDSIFRQSELVINSYSADTIQIRLEAIDARLIGFGYIKAHGLCQIRIRYKDFEKVYCTDIVDGDAHSPLGSNAFVTRKTATRLMASASIRENIEHFLTDLRNMNNETLIE